MFSGVLHKTNPLLLCGACALLVVFFVSTLALPFTAHAAWYNSSWDYRVKITIDNTQVDANLTDFPVYVDLSDLPSGFHTNVKSDGGDIRVTQSDGTTEVPREVVSYDAGTDTGELHFKADGTLSSSTDTEFYIYYGNSGASDYATSATYGAENVWTNNQEGVWHLQEDPSGTAPQMLDSTSSSNDGTSNGSMTSGDLVTGQIGNSLDFDGTDDYVNVGSGDSLDIVNEITVTAWFKGDIFDDRNGIVGHSSSLPRWGLMQDDNGEKRLRAFLYYADGSFASNYSTTVLNPDTWYFAVFTHTNSWGTKLFLNGVEEATFAKTESLGRDHQDAFIGNYGSSNDHFSGSIDDVRIYNRALSADEISAEYTNQNTPTTFYTAGSQEEDSSTSVGMTGSSYNITFDSLNSAGLDTSVSSSYGLLDTVGEVGTGRLSSTSYGIRGGYRQMNSGQISITAPANVTMTNLSGVTANTSTGSVTWTVTTDNPDGYELSIRSSTNPALQDASEGNAIDNYTPSTSDPDFTFSIANSTAEFGFSPEGDDVAQRFLDNGSSCNTGAGNTTDRCWDAFSTSDVVISERATSNQSGGTDTTVKLQAQNGSDHVQEAGTYEAVITVTAVTL